MLFRSTDFLYCYSILESNKRADFKSSNSPTSKVTSSIHPAILSGDSIAAELNTFFPFDPYQLQRSSNYIREIYREWSSVAIDDNESDEDEEDDDSNEDIKSGMRHPESDESDDSHSLDDSSEVIQKSSMLRIPKPPAKVADQAADGLGASLDAMSISPARQGIEALENKAG